MKPTKHQYTILSQICQHIPAYLVSKLALSFGIDKQARSFSPWSHVVAMLHVQIAHSISLNDVADTQISGNGKVHSGGYLPCCVEYYSAVGIFAGFLNCRKVYAEKFRLKLSCLGRKNRSIRPANK